MQAAAVKASIGVLRKAEKDSHVKAMAEMTKEREMLKADRAKEKEEGMNQLKALEKLIRDSK